MKSVPGTTIISLAIVITAFLFSNAYKSKGKANNTISVRGLGTKDFVSDLIVWSGSFVQKRENLKDAYEALDKDRERIKAYLVGKGIKSESIVFSAIDIHKEYDDVYDNNTGRKIKSVFSGFGLLQNVQIESNEVDKVENISRQVSELINAGIEFYSNKPQYFYTKLSQLKIEMIAEATKDANERAKKIAENAGSGIERLKQASVGIFQIIAQNSSEEYTYGGAFNTSSKRKTATITVSLEYIIE